MEVSVCVYVDKIYVCISVMECKRWSSYGGKSKNIFPKEITFMLLFESHVK